MGRGAARGSRSVVAFCETSLTARAGGPPPQAALRRERLPLLVDAEGVLEVRRQVWGSWPLGPDPTSNVVPVGCPGREDGLALVRVGAGHRHAEDLLEPFAGAGRSSEVRESRCVAIS